jgi:hypothetical protein
VPETSLAASPRNVNVSAHISGTVPEVHT